MSDSTYAQNADDVQRKQQEQVAELVKRERQALEAAQTQWALDASILAEKMEQLARKLSTEAATLREAASERRIYKHVTNVLGVVQGSGSEIDIRCATLGESAVRIEALAHSLNTVSNIRTMMDELAKQARDAQYMREHNR